MTTIERIYGALRAALVEFADKTSSRPYKAASDPFSFDLQPRTDLDAWYVDPPATQSTGLVGDVESVQAQITIWLSHEAGEDAQGAALALAGDLARLRHAVLGLTFDGPADANIHQNIAAHVQARGEGEVTVIGRLSVGLDYIADSENP